MENAAEALKLAAWVLIFVVALGFTMSTLSLIKQNIDQISLLSDREYLANYHTSMINSETSAMHSSIAESGGINLTMLNTRRVVGPETVVTTMYRALKERIRVEFGTTLFWRLNKDTGKYQGVTAIDLDELKFSKDMNEKKFFIKRIMMGKSAETNGTAKEKEYANSIRTNNNLAFYGDSWTDNLGGSYYTNDFSVYNEIKKHNWAEHIGTYHPDEYKNTGENIPKSQMDSKRIVTYWYASGELD